MAKTTLKSLSDALAARLIKGALPGEIAGLRQGRARARPPRFVAATAATPPARHAGDRARADRGERPPPPHAARDRQRRHAVPGRFDRRDDRRARHRDRPHHPPRHRASRATPTGALTAIGDAARRESMIYIEMERADARDAARSGRRARSATWRDVRAAVDRLAGAAGGDGRRCRALIADGNARARALLQLVPRRRDDAARA